MTMETENNDNELGCDALLSRLDHKCGMYFFNWLMGEWVADPCRLEHVSVKTIIEAYDKRKSMFSDNS